MRLLRNRPAALATISPPPSVPAPPVASAASDLPRLARHLPAVCAAALATLGALMLASLMIGDIVLEPGQVVAVLRGRPEAGFHEHIVIGLRLPRALIAVAAGAMLALAGALLQAATGNVLAEPSLLGVSNGAVLAVVGTLTLTGLTHLPGLVGGGIALTGGLGAGALVYLLSWSRRVGPVRLLLEGVLVSAILGSLVSVLLLLDGALFPAVLRWVIGSLNGRVWQDWAVLWPWALIAIPAGLLAVRYASTLWLGDDVASAVGLRAERARLVVLVTATTLTSGAVTAVGAIGFIGLIAPHLARLLVGSHPRRVLPLATVVGATLLVGADLVAELLTLTWPASGVQNRATVPTGAVTAVVGGPLLVAMLARRRT